MFGRKPIRSGRDGSLFGGPLQPTTSSNAINTGRNIETSRSRNQAPAMADSKLNRLEQQSIHRVSNENNRDHYGHHLGDIQQLAPGGQQLAQASGHEQQLSGQKSSPREAPAQLET